MTSVLAWSEIRLNGVPRDPGIKVKSFQNKQDYQFTDDGNETQGKRMKLK